jgi:hypothetical protein
LYGEFLIFGGSDVDRSISAKETPQVAHRAPAFADSLPTRARRKAVDCKSTVTREEMLVTVMLVLATLTLVLIG